MHTVLGLTPSTVSAAVCAYKLSTWKTEAEGSGVFCHLGLHSEVWSQSGLHGTLPQKKEEEEEKKEGEGIRTRVH